MASEFPNFRSLSRLFIPTSQEALISSQKKLLKHFVKADITHDQVYLPSGKLNFIEAKRKNQSSVENPSTLILMHGLGCGVGIFFANYDDLLKTYDRVIAIDWLGMGGSSRPKFPKRSSINYIIEGNGINSESFVSKHLVKKNLRESVDFFVDSLEEFRVFHGIKDFTLAGHSIGGYLSAKYVIKYPEHVNGLALISPVGLPSPPKDSISLPSKPLSLSFLQAAWSINVTPQSVIRFLGPRGKSYVHNAISRRFSARYSSGVNWNSEEADMISEYMYHITVAEPSGEYSMNSLLTPIYYAKRIKSRDPREPDSIKVSGSVYAREPLLEDLAKCLKKSSSHKKVVPLLIQFGDNDWLSYENVESDINYLKNHHGIEAQLDIIKSAGHHLYLENPTDFSASLSNLKNKYGL